MELLLSDNYGYLLVCSSKLALKPNAMTNWHIVFTQVLSILLSSSPTQLMNRHNMIFTSSQSFGLKYKFTCNLQARTINRTLIQTSPSQSSLNNTLYLQRYAPIPFNSSSKSHYSPLEQKHHTTIPQTPKVCIFFLPIPIVSAKTQELHAIQTILKLPLSFQASKKANPIYRSIPKWINSN